MAWQDRPYYRDRSSSAGGPLMWLLNGSVPLFTAFGIRVRPQVRLQVPERWRRMLPLPLAVFLYGLMLGPGVATYAPTTAAAALIALSLALGKLAPPLVIGLFLAAGKALPVIVLALRGGADKPGRDTRMVWQCSGGQLTSAHCFSISDSQKTLIIFKGLYIDFGIRGSAAVLR